MYVRVGAGIAFSTGSRTRARKGFTCAARFYIFQRDRNLTCVKEKENINE